MKNLRRGRGNEWGPSEYEVNNVPRVSVYRAGAQSVSSNVLYSAIWDSVEYDTDGMWNVANPTVLTCRTAGLWRVTGWWTWDANGTGQRAMLIWRTQGVGGTQNLYPAGGLLGEGASIIAQTGGLYCVVGPLSYDIPMNPGDWLTMRCMQFTAPVVNLAAIPATLVNRSNGFQATLLSTI